MAVKLTLVAIALLAVVAIGVATQMASTNSETTSGAANPTVVMETSMGTIKIELFQDKAPVTVANFLSYVDRKHYDGTIFHRVISDFMIQGGGFDMDYKEKETSEPIKNEADNGLKNQRGTLAMARTGDPNSATAQFFINVKDNAGLDRPKPDGFGYAVFGKVIEGMEVVDQIKGVKTGSRKLTMRNKRSGQLIEAPSDDVPAVQVVIKSVKKQ
jgi:cyclophilin family peptidyl-prolyl cis-trans isomerase